MSKNDPTFFVDRASSPSERLAAAVLNRAVLDLFMKATRTLAGDGPPTMIEKRDTIRFLTDSWGAHAASRAAWCAIAGMNPDVVREKILAFLNGDDTMTTKMAGPMQGHGSLDPEQLRENVAQTRALWADMQRRPTRSVPQAPRERSRPRPVPARIDHADLTARVLTALESGPKSIRQIVFALDGDVGTDPIRKTLDALIEIGRVRRSPPDYALFKQGANHSAPHLLVAATR